MKKIKLLCNLLAGTVAISSLSGCSKGISSYEKLMEQFQTSFNENDAELLSQVYLTEGMIAYAEKEEDMDNADIIDEFEDILDDEIDYWEDKCGDDITVTIEIKDAEKIDDEDDIEDIIEDYDKQFDDKIEIKEAYKLECRLKYKGKDDSDKTTMEYTALNIKGQGWKLSALDLISNEEEYERGEAATEAAPPAKSDYDISFDFGMTDYINSSKVTSANATAAMLKNCIDTFLTEADTLGYGMLQGNSYYDTLIITVKDSVWQIMPCNPSNYKTGSDMIWGGYGIGNSSMSKTDITCPETLMAIDLALLFPEIENASIIAFCQGGYCRVVAYTGDTSEMLIIGEDCPDISFDSNDYRAYWNTDYKWSEKYDGITNSGLIVGTSPQNIN